MAGKYRRGETWTLTWIESGRQVRRSLGRITEAETARVAKEQALGHVAISGPAFATWAAQYADWHSQEYPESYFRVEQILRQHLIPALRHTPVLTIGREQIEDYKRLQLTDAKANTVIKEIRTLQACLNHAVNLGIIPHNPVARVKAPRDLTSRPPRWYSREELTALYAATLDLLPRYRWSWQLLANTSMRRAEALHLQWRNVGKQEIGIRSEEDARTKSGKWRAIPISNGAREALDRASLDGSIHCLVCATLTAATSFNPAYRCAPCRC
jgi:integrase